MKKTGIVLFVAAVLSASSLWAKEKKAKAPKEQVVIVGTEGAYPPYNFVDKKGNVDGYDIDVIKAIDERHSRIYF